MSETVYARLPEPGVVEIVLRRKDACEVFRVPDAAFAALFDTVVSAARHRLRAPSPGPAPGKVNDAPDGLIWTPWGLMAGGDTRDKSGRRYGRRA